MSQQDGLIPDPINNRIAKGDAKPEVYYFGQIVGAEGFGISPSQGIFCEMLCDIGKNWEELQSHRLVQTQTSYGEINNINVWNHPIDISFATNDLNGWPKAIFKVWRLDESNKIDIIAYGSCPLPKQQGYHKIECQTFSLAGSANESNDYNALSFYLGNQPRIQAVDFFTTGDDKREQINTVSSGTVHLEIDCLLRNFSLLGLSGQSD